MSVPIETNAELIKELQKYPADARVALRGSNFIEVNSINPNGPECCIWIDPFGTNLLAESIFDDNEPESLAPL